MCVDQCYLLAVITTIGNQLARYVQVIAQNDVMSRVTETLGAVQYVQPRPDVTTLLFSAYYLRN